MRVERIPPPYDPEHDRIQITLSISEARVLHGNLDLGVMLETDRTGIFTKLRNHLEDAGGADIVEHSSQISAAFYNRLLDYFKQVEGV